MMILGAVRLDFLGMALNCWRLLVIVDDFRAFPKSLDFVRGAYTTHFPHRNTSNSQRLYNVFSKCFVGENLFMVFGDFWRLLVIFDDFRAFRKFRRKKVTLEMARVRAGRTNPAFRS